MAEDKKKIDLKLSSLSRFGLRVRGRGGAGSSRLPSLKPTRDLTMGGAAPKRTFQPNIVGRSVKMEDNSSDIASGQPKNRYNRSTGRGKNRGRGGRGRGEVILSTGIFSQGIFAKQTLAGALSSGSGYAGNYDKDDSAPGGSKSSLIKNVKGEEEIESNKILEMLTVEGKIEIGDEEIQAGGLTPITLPLVSKLVNKIKQDDIKTENDVSHDEDEVSKPSVSAKVKKPIEKTVDTSKVIDLADIFENDIPDGQIFFLQLPDTLPIKPIEQSDDMKMEQDLLVADKKTPEEDIEEQLKKFTFHSVSEGHIGKLQIHKSGKVTMQLGNVALDISLGTPCGFLQDLISVHTEKNPAEMVSLGHVQHKLIAIPDYKSLLGSLIS